MLRRLLAVAVILGALAGCSGDDGNEGPTATVAAPDREPTTTSTTEAPTPEEEVEAAYLKSWEIYAEAVRKLDDSRLEEIYAGDALALRREELAEYRRDKTPVKVDVDHDYAISIFTEGRALVIDSYFNRSVYVDPETGEPTEPEPNKTVNRQYELRRVGDTWKVFFVKAL